MTEFALLAEVLDRVSRTRRRSEKVALAGEFLRTVEIDEVSQAALYLSGRIFAESDQRTLNISWKGLLNALRKVVEFDDNTLSEAYEGDIGEAVAKVLEDSKKFITSRCRIRRTSRMRCSWTQKSHVSPLCSQKSFR